MRSWIVFWLGCSLLGPAAQAGGILDSIQHRHKLYDIAALGDDLFFVGFPGLVIHSKDRGKTFETLRVGTEDALFSISLAEDGTGFMVGRSGLLFSTADRGKTWTKKASGVSAHLFDVAAVPGGEGWAVGNFGTILHLPPGGAAPEKQSFDSSLPLSAASAPAAKSNEEAEFSNAEQENEGAVEESRLNSVTFGDNQHGWIVGEFGLILATADGGKSWKRQRNPVGKLMFNVQAQDARKVLAAGADGTLVETQNAGASWTLVPTGESFHIFGFWPAADKLVIVGQDGMAMSRKAGETAFVKLPMGLYTWISAVRFLDPQLGFAVGGRGHLMRTEDGGATWMTLAGK